MIGKIIYPRGVFTVADDCSVEGGAKHERQALEMRLREYKKTWHEAMGPFAVDLLTKTAQTLGGRLEMPEPPKTETPAVGDETENIEDEA